MEAHLLFLLQFYGPKSLASTIYPSHVERIAVCQFNQRKTL